MEERLDNEAFSADDIVRDRALGPDDQDALRHAPIANLVAELVASGATPLNVALYGAWGSGKSSFFSLLKSALKTRKESIAIVRYDAWKYSGQGLQRNFMSD